MNFNNSASPLNFDTSISPGSFNDIDECLHSQNDIETEALLDFDIFNSNTYSEAAPSIDHSHSTLSSQDRLDVLEMLCYYLQQQ